MARSTTQHPKVTILLDEQRKKKLTACAARAGVSTTELVRRWIDAGCPTKER